jgi:hypothetical protein
MNTDFQEFPELANVGVGGEGKVERLGRGVAKIWSHGLGIINKS